VSATLQRIARSTTTALNRDRATTAAEVDVVGRIPVVDQGGRRRGIHSGNGLVTGVDMTLDAVAELVDAGTTPADVGYPDRLELPIWTTRLR
jgi:hypothetical protein